MFGSPVLEVILALAGVYLGLGLVCAAFCEMFSSWQRWRSRMLVSGLRALLSGSRDHDGRPLADRFFQAPLIASLSPERANGRAAGESLPPHLPSRTVTITLLELIQPADWSGEPITFNDYARMVERLPDTEFKQALQAIGRSSSYDIERVRNNLDTWFENVMAGISDKYRRRLWSTSLVISALLCGSLGVDALALVGTVWGEAVRLTDRRPTTVFISSPETRTPFGASDPIERPVQTTDPPELVNRIPSPTAPVSPSVTKIEPLLQTNVLSDRVTPISTSQRIHTATFPRLSQIAELLPHFLGLLLSTIVVAICARIDFDLLNRFTNFRLGSSSLSAKLSRDQIDSRRETVIEPNSTHIRGASKEQPNSQEDLT